MLPINEVQAKAHDVINHTVELNETVTQGAVKVTEEVGIFYKRIIEGKPTDHYHITNAFKKIVSKNIDAMQQYFKSFQA